jgi:aryl-alcohol dehydrogenase-like predicted oxidoreductase
MADQLPTAYQGVAEVSLERLKTDVIALFYQPRVDPSCRSKMSRE